MPAIDRFISQVGCVLCLTVCCSAQEPVKSDSLNESDLRRTVERAIVDGNHEVAWQHLKNLTERDPTNATAMYHLGREAFCTGKIEQSLAAFDRYLELVPSRKTSLWERGITCYYAKKFDEGRKQFELYQTYHSQDVENGVWHILCESGVNGFEKASLKSLDIRNDSRVPMMKIYDLFRNKATPNDVLKAAETPGSESEINRQRFYANLYVGLYHEVTGEKEKATVHMKRAVKHRIDHYMWDVARVHSQRNQTDKPRQNKKDHAAGAGSRVVPKG